MTSPLWFTREVKVYLGHRPVLRHGVFYIVFEGGELLIFYQTLRIGVRSILSYKHKSTQSSEFYVV